MAVEGRRGDAPARLLRAARAPQGAPVLLDAATVARVRRAVGSWPGYAPTPLHRLGRLARNLGLGEIWYKDEAGRFGIGSFKALGAGYALWAKLRQEALPAGVTAVCATDGNHGRALAWAAARLGCRSVIYVHDGVSPGRRAAIARYGARIVAAGASYDEAVRRAARDARRHGWLHVSDTAYPGFTEIPTLVMHGYTVVLDEVAQALPPSEAISHVFVQAGVGGIAAAVLDAAPLYPSLRGAAGVVVEPEAAACLFASAAADRLTEVGGPLDTLMAGLACGVPSLVAWEVLRRRAAAYLRIPDEAAVATMRLLARGEGHGAPLVAGESGVAGLAGLGVAAHDPALREALGLGPSSRVLVIGTEGATDPDLYQRFVGAPPGAVERGSEGAS